MIFKLLCPGHFGTSFVFIPFLGPMLWAIKVGLMRKNQIFGKYKMAATDQIIHLTKKFRRKKSKTNIGAWQQLSQKTGKSQNFSLQRISYLKNFVVF